MNLLLPLQHGSSPVAGQYLKRLLLPALALLFAFFAGGARAGDLEDGDKAAARKDFAQALAAYRKAAASGNAEAQFKLGTLYAKGQGTPQNFRDAAAWFLQAATKGYALAQNSLGVRYEKGQGVPQNITRAAALYREAAEQRLGLAQDNLSDLYAKGLGVDKDLVLAHVWSSLASANGEAAATRKRTALERGMSKPQLAESHTHLGMMYARGRGVAQDERKSVQWLQKAADAGFVVAQFELANCYDKGIGVAKNASTATKWYARAAAQGHARAQATVAYMYDTGAGVEADPKRAANWYGLAAAQGDNVAQYNLGAMFESGRGITQDHIEAHKWFNIAEVNGNKQATDARRLVETLMTPEQIEEAQRRASAWLKSKAN